MRNRLISVLLFFISFYQISEAIDSCQKLAICALDKCIAPASTYPPLEDVVRNLLNKTNFACVLGPTCYEFCKDCETCQYAQEQMKHLILRESTSGKCPKLEECAHSCLRDHMRDPFSCVFKDRCVQYCLDNQDCPQCFELVKRVFTGFCYRGGFIEHYGKKCKPLFDETAETLVSNIVAS